MEAQAQPALTPNILLDTCILQYAGNPDSSAAFRAYLIEFNNRNRLLMISEFVIFEALDRAPKKKERKILEMLEIFKRFEVSYQVLDMAAMLSSLYQEEEIPDSQIGDGDKIIAATSVLTGCDILTANVNDFPRPFFIEREIKHVFYKRKKRDVMIPVYLLAPDIPLINERIKRKIGTKS